MDLTRRAFALGVGGATAATLVRAPALGAAPAAAATAPTSAALAPALAAIWAYAEENRRVANLPALTVGLAIPGVEAITGKFGFASLGARTPLSDQTLFQIGSISKLLSAAIIHQFVAEGRLSLADQIAVLMPAIPVPKGDGITVQHLLDHVSGLPDDAPLFADGGLWTGFKPGTHWSYSNTGYDIIGKLIEHIGRQPLARQLHDRLFRPLGMANTKGAIVASDRTLYAQGYEQADNIAPFIAGEPLAPASWVDVTFGAGSTVSTAADMARLMRSLAAAALGQGGLGLSPAAGLAFTRHAVPSDSLAMRYGNGLMHVGAGSRSALHHTGGMVAFSSSFHVDTQSGVGAFASTSLSGLAGYRPRALTQFALDAINAARSGRPIPAPPPLLPRIDRPGDYAGVYSGPGGSFTVTVAGTGLGLAADGVEARLEPVGGSIFKTRHPRFRESAILFEAPAGQGIAGASWQSQTFVKAGAHWSPPPSDPDLARLAGRYVNDSPWWGVATIFERGGRLWAGTEGRLTRIGDNLWRAGEEVWSPERISFADPIDGRPQTMIFSGNKFIRHDV